MTPGDRWRLALRSPRWWEQLAIGSTAVAGLAFVVPAVFAVVGDRPGATPVDPLLAVLPALQLSVPIFAVQYAAIALAAVRLARHPDLLPRVVQAAALMVVARMTTIGLVALDPPPDLVPLHDPVNQLLYPGAEPLTRDLFFSGHTAVMVMLVCLARPGPARWVMVGAAVAVGGMLLLQHAHWAVDVLAAPLFAGSAWWVSGRTSNPDEPSGPLRR